MSEPFSKQKIYIVEIDLPYCDLSYNVGACNPSPVLSGDNKCFNTLATCQAVAAYTANNSIKTYRLCEQLSPHPIGLDAIPNLTGVSISPAQIQIDGGLGVRSSLSLTFNDHPSSDLGLDKYLNDRTYIAMERGFFWAKLRARNPFYQNAPLRLISAYVVNNVVDMANATTYHYILEDLDVSRGSCSIKAKDPLKLADNKRAQAPLPSAGEIDRDLTASTTSFSLLPAGVGADYLASGFIRISKEVMSYTRTGDAFTVVRGQYNTQAIEHAEGDTAQLCLVYSDTLDVIEKDLLVNYAGVDASFINDAFWAAEVDDNLSGLIGGIITEPTGVTKLLKELGEQFPHSLYWDERTQRIELIAIKPPPDTANTYDEFGSLISDSVTIQDKRDMRISTVLVYYGQIDPTLKLDETNNYAGTYARINGDSAIRYGSNEIKTIFSRWILRDNKAQALRLAARIGRRFGSVPRAISFELDPKDKSLWAGEVAGINNKFLSDFTGLPSTVLFQIITAQETDNFRYTGIEYIYDPLLPEDEGGGDDGVTLLIIEGERNNYNIRDVYDLLEPTADETTKVKVIIESGAIVGSTSTSTPAMDTGTWPVGATVEIEVRNFLVGRGGTGSSSQLAAGGAGGIALRLQHPVIINNLGVIGGGGGGGGAASDVNGNIAAGGGGAGQSVGLAGNNTIETTPFPFNTPPLSGTLEFGGDGGFVETDTIADAISGGRGGNLGVTGAIGENGVNSNGGAAGLAIQTLGNAITYTTVGDIRGAVV